MTKSVVTNYTDTPISGVSSLTFPRGLVNYAADWKVKENEPEEVILTNLTSPMNFPEKMRFAFSEASDVYKSSGLEPALYAPSRRGVSVLGQITDVWTVVDSVDATYQVALPVSAHLVLKVPKNENITPAMVQTLVGRLVSGLFDTGSTETSRLAALLRGSMIPSDLK